MKITTRRLERIYRAAPTEEARHRCHENLCCNVMRSGKGALNTGPQ